jgi:hypothetical protein
MAPARFESVCEGGEQIRYGRLRLRLPGHQGRSLIGASWSSMTSGLFKQGSKRLPGSTLPPCQHAQGGNDEQRRPDHLPAGESGELSIPSGWRQITSTATLMRITTSDSRLRTGLRPRSTPPHSPPKAVRIGRSGAFSAGSRAPAALRSGVTINIRKPARQKFEMLDQARETRQAFASVRIKIDAAIVGEALAVTHTVATHAHIPSTTAGVRHSPRGRRWAIAAASARRLALRLRICTIGHGPYRHHLRDQSSPQLAGPPMLLYYYVGAFPDRGPPLGREPQAKEYCSLGSWRSVY